MIRYIELKTGYEHNGPAWICRPKLSKSGRTVYFNNKSLSNIGGAGISGNHQDIETGEEYWISGIKKDGGDRHIFGSGKIYIESSVVEDYLQARGLKTLGSQYVVIEDLEETDISKFTEIENQKL